MFGLHQTCPHTLPRGVKPKLKFPLVPGMLASVHTADMCTDGNWSESVICLHNQNNVYEDKHKKLNKTWNAVGATIKIMLREKCHAC